MAEINATLGQLNEEVAASGHFTMAVGIREALQLRTRLVKQAWARDELRRHTIRGCLLSMRASSTNMPESGDELLEFDRAISEFALNFSSPLMLIAVDFHDWRGPPDAGLVLVRELNERLGLGKRFSSE